MWKNKGQNKPARYIYNNEEYKLCLYNGDVEDLRVNIRHCMLSVVKNESQLAKNTLMHLVKGKNFYQP